LHSWQDTEVVCRKEAFWNICAEEAAMGDRPTVVEDDELDGAGAAMPNGISRTGATLCYR
jgi:hypothetical protein